MAPDQIADRMRRIRLSRKDLALAAQLDPNTVGRTLSRRTDPRYGTLQALGTALLDEERQLLRYLLDLHGEPEQQERAA